MGYLFKQRLPHCRTQSLLTGPEASSLGLYSQSSSKASKGTIRRCQKYPRAHSCLPIQFNIWRRGKGKSCYSCHILLSPTIPFSLPSSSKMVSHDPNSKPPCSTHTQHRQTGKTPVPKPPAQKVCELVNCLQDLKDKMRSEVACRTSSNWQGLPLVLLSGRTQSKYPEHGAGEKICLKELRQGWTDGDKIVAILPKTKVENQNQVKTTQQELIVQVYIQAVCLFGDLDSHAYWNSIHCDSKLNDPRGKSCLGVFVDVWGEW